MMPTAQTLYEVTEATWPPHSRQARAGFVFRDGRGGGQRVSATTLAPGYEGGAVTDAALARAETQMADMGQPALFMIRQGEEAFDARLAARGYAIHDSVNLYACPIDALTDQVPPRVSTFVIWEPLRIQHEIWARGGIGPGRLAVMERCPLPKAAVLGRWNEKPAATAYVAIHDSVAMVHAVEVVPEQRQQGMAKWIMRAAAIWAAEQGATHMSLVTTQANAAANALYASLGMMLVGQYHYRIKKD